MSCFHPLKIYLPLDKVTGEIGGPKFDRQEVWAFEKACERDGTPGFLVPCGQCFGCRRDQAALWRDRLVLEEQATPPGQSWFVTLTYNEDYLPRAFTIDRETGAEGILGVLRFDDVSTWIKRVRDRLDVVGLRYYAAGEYGENTRRPHYHVLLFGTSIPDARSFLPTDEGYVKLPEKTLFSQILQDCWSDVMVKPRRPYGVVTFRPADCMNIAYTAGYSLKKLRGLHEKQYQELIELERSGNPLLVPQPREAARMSRRPGIGVPAIVDRDPRDLWRTGSIAVSDTRGAHLRALPRVFERPALPDAADLIERAKNNRIEQAKNARWLKVKAAQCKDEELFRMAEEEAKTKDRLFRRLKSRDPVSLN